MAEVLSDEQIDQLLVEPETRLASKGAPAKSVTRKENTALVPSSAAQSGKEPQKPVADKLSVRIPQLVAKKGKVCNRPLSCPNLMMKLFSQIHLTQRDIPLWETLLHPHDFY